MVEIIALLANIVTIIAGVLSFFTVLRSYRNILVFIAVCFACFDFAIIIYIYLQNKPVVTILTSLTSFKEGHYEGKQQQFYSFPFNYYDKELLNIKFGFGGVKKDDKLVRSYSAYMIGSNVKHSDLEASISKNFSAPKDINSQVLIYNNFINTLEISDGSVWHKPLGWAGLNYDTEKVYPAHEIIFILDFREIKINNSQKQILKSPPRFLFVKRVSPKPEEIPEQGEELIKNRFKEMQVLPDSKGLVWFQRIENPPQGWVILIWEPTI